MIEVMGLSEPHELDNGVTVLYDQLTDVIKDSLEKDSSETRHKYVNDAVTQLTSRKYAQESYRQGYTISQLVRGYGSLCQGITEYALENGIRITSAEFAQLNLGLDIAIAQAVTEFQKIALGSVEKSEKQKLGFLVHELRNSLSSAVLAYELVRMGRVGSSGATSHIIVNALNQMRELIDHSVAGVRMSTNHELELSVFKLIDLLSEVESSLASESNAKYLIVYMEADPDVEVEADRHLMVSAVTNLMQNAIKYTKVGSSVRMRAMVDGRDVVIEVEDQCGGLPEGKAEELLRPSSQINFEPGSSGIGLSIVRRACELNGCDLTIRNMPGAGCIFSIRMPSYQDVFLYGFGKKGASTDASKLRPEN